MGLIGWHRFLHDFLFLTHTVFSQYGHSDCSRFGSFDATAGAKKQGK